MTNTTVITTYKGFNQDLTCRDFQYAIGEVHQHIGEVKECRSGFHACKRPMDIFRFYSPVDARFFKVEQSGKTSEGDCKVASEYIELKVEITLQGLVDDTVEALLNEVESSEDNTGAYSASTNTGDYSASTNTGNYSASTNTGNYSASTNTGNYSASTNTGDCSASTNTGDCSASTNTGKESLAIVTGYNSKAKAGEGSWIVIVERNSSGEILTVKTGKAGVDVKPDVFYKVIGGEFVECTD